MDNVGLVLILMGFLSSIIVSFYVIARNLYLTPPSNSNGISTRDKFFENVIVIFTTIQVLFIKLLGIVLNRVSLRWMSYCAVLILFILLPLLDTTPPGNDSSFIKFFSKLPSSIFSVAWKDLSVFLAFFYFIYAQHKSASRARNFFANRPALLFFTAFSISIIYSLFLKENFYPNSHTSTAIALSIILYITSIILFMWMFYDATRSLSVRMLLPYTINSWTYTLIGLYLNPFFPSLTHNSERLFKFLNSYHESIYQLLEYCIKNNMRTVFLNNYTKWYTFIIKLNDRPFSRSKFQLDEIYKALSSRYQRDYEFFYEAVLNSQVRLISQLFKEGDGSTAEKIIDEFFKLPIPIEKNLCLIHFGVIKELCVSMAKDHPTSLPRVYSHIFKIAADYSSKSSSTYQECLNDLFKELINFAIYKHDISILSGVVYTLKKCSSRIEKDTNFSAQNELAQNRYLKRVLNGQKAQIISPSEKQKQFIEVGVDTLLLAALKSIELGYYDSTGFLVKFLITGFPSQIVNTRYSKLMKKIGIQRDFSGGDIVLNFPFDESTVLYCIQKLGLLIFGQQNYVLYQSVDFGFIPKELLDITLLECNYLKYLLDKILVVGSHYGLLFPMDKEFMNDFVQQLGLIGLETIHQ